MNNLRKTRALSITLALLLVFLAVPARASAAEATVNLGKTASFAVLAGTTITNTGPTTINGDAGGDVGLHPGSGFPGQTDVTISGVVHLADAVALQAKNDLIVAYDDAAGRTPVTRIATELGGKTLKPGVYDSASGTFHITGTLTLDAQDDPNNDVFIFKTTTTLITASNSKINIVNGARYCRIFWKVGSSATLGTNSYFVGHIFALTSITAKTKAKVQGQLLARNGAVTLDSNTITNGFCAAIATPTPTTTETTTSTDTTTPTTTETTTSTDTTTTSTDTTTTSTDTTTTSTTEQELPKTGESGPSVIIGFGLLGLAGALALILRRKKSR